MLPDSPYVSQASGLGLSNLRQRELMQAVLGRGAQFRFEALGFSMAPFIQHGDILTIAPLTAPASLRPGVVVAFIQTENETLIVHRLIAIQDDRLIFQGDNNPEADSPVTIAQVLGLLVAIQRDGRRVRLGLGLTGLWIAGLQRRGWLRRLMQAGLFVRRPFSAGLHRLQGSRVYRAWVKRVAGPFKVEEATARDLIEVQARTNPNSEVSTPKATANVTHLVAKQGKHLLGYLAVVRYGPQDTPFSGIWAMGLLVFGRYRGMGIARALAQHAIAIGRREGYKSGRLMVFADNLPALPFYRQLGFAEIDAPELVAKLAELSSITGRKYLVMEIDLTTDGLQNDG